MRQQVREIQATRKVQARKEKRTAKTHFSVAVHLLAVTAPRTDVVNRYWHHCGEDDHGAEIKTSDVVTHFLAIEPVAVAEMLDATSGPGGVALKKAMSFLINEETLSWVRAQHVRKGLAPSRRSVIQTRENMRVRVRTDANATVAQRLKLKTSAAAYKWAQRWRRSLGVLSGAFHARKVRPPAELLCKAPALHSIATPLLPVRPFRGPNLGLFGRTPKAFKLVKPNGKGEQG